MYVSYRSAAQTLRVAAFWPILSSHLSSRDRYLPSRGGTRPGKRRRVRCRILSHGPRTDKSTDSGRGFRGRQNDSTLCVGRRAERAHGGRAAVSNRSVRRTEAACEHVGVACEAVGNDWIKLNRSTSVDMPRLWPECILSRFYRNENHDARLSELLSCVVSIAQQRAARYSLRAHVCSAAIATWNLSVSNRVDHLLHATV